MPAVAKSEELKAVQERLDSLWNVEYRNIIRLFPGEATLGKLKVME